jgi:hypothetical protein
MGEASYFSIYKFKDENKVKDQEKDIIDKIYSGISTNCLILFLLKVFKKFKIKTVASKGICVRLKKMCVKKMIS